MRPETKKLIEKKVKAYRRAWSDTNVKVVPTRDIQEIIDFETKPLHQEIEKIKEAQKRLRDEFAMRAMELVYPIHEDDRTVAKRCYEIADAMLQERDNERSVVSNLKEFISNCKDIPEDIQKIIDENFFDLL